MQHYLQKMEWNGTCLLDPSTCDILGEVLRVNRALLIL